MHDIFEESELDIPQVAAVNTCFRRERALDLAVEIGDLRGIMYYLDATSKGWQQYIQSLDFSGPVAFVDPVHQEVWQLAKSAHDAVIYPVEMLRTLYHAL